MPVIDSGHDCSHTLCIVSSLVKVRITSLDFARWGNWLVQQRHSFQFSSQIIMRPPSEGQTWLQLALVCLQRSAFIVFYCLFRGTQIYLLTSILHSDTHCVLKFIGRQHDYKKCHTQDILNILVPYYSPNIVSWFIPSTFQIFVIWVVII